MSILSEFKTFAMRGNVVDLAVGVVIGGAFGKIVTSLVNDVIMPPIGVLLGGVSFKDLVITLKAAAGEVPAVTLNYGAFIQTIIDFILVALAIFFLIKGINAMQKKPAPAPAKAAELTREEKLLTEIRDALRRK